MRDPYTADSGGRGAGAPIHVGDWIGWTDRLAHPDAPAGGGGPGQFSRVLARNDAEGAPDPWSPRGTAFGLDSEGGTDPAPRPAQPPPATTPKAINATRVQSGDYIDVNIDAALRADKSTGGPSNSASTRIRMPKQSMPNYSASGGKITKFTSKLVWKGTISVQTSYGSGVTAASLSCYGRGTTDQDIAAGRVTLGFHESCHRADHIDYLETHPLPEAPELTVGMLVSEYNSLTQAFHQQIVDYVDRADANTKAKTDEVGRRPLSDVGAKGCYVHKLP